ncbi:hypothetical protein HHI36_002971 [Cryptolaemus montrouzieri]|uniref:Uncharacterized protein n=1 Tax=Cryptolaemus montrouzieri TaxID=559131 RepID=A0ABD2PDK1_9CUCU
MANEFYTYIVRLHSVNPLFVKRVNYLIFYLIFQRLKIFITMNRSNEKNKTANDEVTNRMEKQSLVSSADRDVSSSNEAEKTKKLLNKKKYIQNYSAQWEVDFLWCRKGCNSNFPKSNSFKKIRKGRIT